MKIPIHESFRGSTIAEYLCVLWPERPRRVIDDLFARGRIRSGGMPSSPRRILENVSDLELVGTLDDLPTIFQKGGTDAGISPGIQILHEDERIAAISKPSGVPVIPDRSREGESCLGLLTRHELRSRAEKPPEAMIRYRTVHRIDRLTSGLVLFARTPESERRLSADFENRRVQKEYLAILRGVVEPAMFAVHCPVTPGRKGKMRAAVGAGAVGPGGSPAGDAITDFEVIERFDGFTFVRARPLTGRTHQIRVHAWAAGYPLAVDPLYGAKNGGPLPGMARLSLHARRYGLPEDWDDPRAFESPIPEDFASALEALRRGI